MSENKNSKVKVKVIISKNVQSLDTKRCMAFL